MVLSSPCLAPWGDLGTIEGADAGPQLLILPAPGSHLRVTVLGGLPLDTQVGRALGQRCVLLLLNEIALFSKEARLSAHFPRDSLVTAGAPTLQAGGEEAGRCFPWKGHSQINPQRLGKFHSSARGPANSRSKGHHFF